MVTVEDNSSNQQGCGVLLKVSSWLSQFRNASNPKMARYVYALIFLVCNLLAWASRDELPGRSVLTKLKGKLAWVLGLINFHIPSPLKLSSCLEIHLQLILKLESCMLWKLVRKLVKIMWTEAKVKGTYFVHHDLDFTMVSERVSKHALNYW